MNIRSNNRLKVGSSNEISADTRESGSIIKNTGGPNKREYVIDSLIVEKYLKEQNLKEEKKR